MKNGTFSPLLHRGLSLDTKQLIDEVIDQSKFNNRQNSDASFPTAPKLQFRDPVMSLPGLRNNVSFPDINFVKWRSHLDLEELGKLYMHYVSTRYLLSTRPWLQKDDISKFAVSLVDHLTALYNEQHCDVSFLTYIGQFALSELRAAEGFVLSVFEESPKAMAFAEPFPDHFNALSAHLPPKEEVMDYHLVWDPNAAKMPLEFPALRRPSENFHYLYMCDVGRSFPRITAIGPISRRLDVLEQFGKLSFEFHAAHSLLMAYKTSDHTFGEIASRIMGKFDSILRLSSFRKVLKGEDLVYCGSTTMFHRYLGLFDLCNSPGEVSSWLQILVKWQRKGDSDVSLEGLSRSGPDVKYLKHLPKVPKISLPSNMAATLAEIGDLGEEIRFDEVEGLGKDFLDMVFMKYLIREKPLQYATYDAHVEQLSSFVEDHFNDVKIDFDIVPREPSILTEDYNYLTFIGLYSLVDSVACEKFLMGAVEGCQNADFDHFKRYLRLKSYQQGTPYLGLNEDYIPQKPGLLNLPGLKDYSDTTRTLLMHNSSLFSTVKGSTNLLQDALHHWSKLGHRAYRFYTRQALLTKMSPSSAPYYRLIVGLLNSDLLARFVLDQTRVFDGLLASEQYERELVRWRHGSALVNTQMRQYFLALVINSTDEELKEWAAKFVLVFLSIVEHGSAAETSKIVGYFYKALKAYDFSLYSKYRKNWIEKLEVDNIAKRLTSLTPEAPETESLAENLGKYYIAYLAYKRSLGRRLHTFLDASEETVRLLQAVFETNAVRQNTQAKSAEQYFGTLYLQKGERAATTRLNLVLKVFPGDLGLREADIPIMNFELSAPQRRPSRFWKMGDLSLPELTKSTNLHKLLHVNYEISRSFLWSVKVQKKYVVGLSDYCTKFGTLGEHMYRVYVIEGIHRLKAAHGLQDLVAREMLRIFLDRQFETVVAERSNLLYGPVMDSGYGKLAKRYVRNSHWLLRFGSKSFRQYVGLLAHHDTALLQMWCRDTVEKVFLEIQGKSTHEQMQILQFLGDAVCDEMAAILR